MQLRSLDTDYFFKIPPGVEKKYASVTGNTMKHSVSGGGDNPVLLQEEEENATEETNDDANINAEANDQTG